jgi:hypothetical protein
MNCMPTKLWEYDVFMQVLWDMFEETLGFEPDSGEESVLISIHQRHSN